MKILELLAFLTRHPLTRQFLAVRFKDDVWPVLSRFLNFHNLRTELGGHRSRGTTGERARNRSGQLGNEIFSGDAPLLLRPYHDPICVENPLFGLSYKIQRGVIRCIRESISISRKKRELLGVLEVGEIGSLCLVFLSSVQPEIIQQEALSLFRSLIRADPDALWFMLHELSSLRPLNDSLLCSYSLICGSVEGLEKIEFSQQGVTSPLLTPYFTDGMELLTTFQANAKKLLLYLETREPN